MQFSLHCLQKDTPLSLDGGPVSLPLRRSTTTTLLALLIYQRIVNFSIGFSTSTNSLGGHFLAPSSWLGGSSDVEVAALVLLGSCNLRFHCCHPLTLLLQVKNSSFIDGK
jgi:hypothetical protein